MVHEKEVMIIKDILCSLRTRDAKLILLQFLRGLEDTLEVKRNVLRFLEGFNKVR